MKNREINWFFRARFTPHISREYVRIFLVPLPQIQIAASIGGFTARATFEFLFFTFELELSRVVENRKYRELVESGFFGE